MTRAFFMLILCVLVAACGTARRDDYALPLSPMLFEPAKIARAETLVIGIPGALSSVAIMAPLQDWRSDDVTVAFYRLPGMDGRSRNGNLRLSDAAETISLFVRNSGIRKVHLVGFSTGTAIALESAKALRAADPEMEIKVAGMSSALPLPQPYLAGLRGGSDLVASAWRTGSLRREVFWPEYFRTLLYGPRRARDVSEAQNAEVLLEKRQERISTPDTRIVRSHGFALLNWTNANKAALRDVPVLLFHGEHDRVFPARAVRRFADRLPLARSFIYKDQGHLLFLTFPGIFDEMRRALAIH